MRKGGGTRGIEYNYIDNIYYHNYKGAKYEKQKNIRLIFLCYNVTMLQIDSCNEYCFLNINKC